MNYENRRNQPPGDEEKKIAQKIKNLKLKFSRMLTCFGTLCYISAKTGVIGPDQLVAMTSLPPLERLRVAANGFDAQSAMQRVEEQYGWFLQLTNVSEADLKLQFSDKAFRAEAFKRADAFGDAMFEITQTIAANTGYLRYLVV